MGRKWSKNDKQLAAKKKKRQRQENDDDDEDKPTKIPRTEAAPAVKNTFNEQATKIPIYDLTELPAILKDFWKGSIPNETEFENLKQIRKSLGILVRGTNADKCPEPITSIHSTVLPKEFKAVFEKFILSTPTSVQMQSWPAALAGHNLLCEIHICTKKSEYT